MGGMGGGETFSKIILDVIYGRPLSDNIRWKFLKDGNQFHQVMGHTPNGLY